MNSLFEPPRDEDEKIQYHLMFLNTGIYIYKGDDPCTTRRENNSSYCN